MALYKRSDLKKRNAFNSGVRELETLDNVSKKIWIPKFEFEYIRKHYGIKDRTPFKYSKFNFMPCFNQTLGEDGAGCPICNIVKDTWALWRKCKDKVEQKEYLDIINQLKGEYYALQVIDIDDPDLKFQAISFTQLMFRELEQYEDSEKEVGDAIWYFKKGKAGTTTRYSLTAVDTATDIVKKMKDQYDSLLMRSYDDGGPIDLTKAFNRKFTMKEYMDILEPGGEEKSEEMMNLSKEEKNKPKKDKESSKIELAEEQISLDDLNAIEGIKKEEQKETIPDEQLSLDDISIDSLDSLSLDSLEEPKLISVDAKMVNDKRNDKPFIEHLIKFFLPNKQLELEGKQYKDAIKIIYRHVKSLIKVDVPEMK